MKPEEIVNQIDEIIRKGVWKNIENPEGLSQDILRLATLNTGLGNYLVDARDEERLLETEYKYAVDRCKLDYVKLGDSATVAESKAKIDAQELLDAAHAATKRVDILKLKRDDVSQIIDAARSRLSLIKSDMRNA